MIYASVTTMRLVMWLLLMLRTIQTMSTTTKNVLRLGLGCFTTKQLSRSRGYWIHSLRPTSSIHG
ncbi:hypothetical protein HanXRQr2_Chr13g0600851 [Helianthus annuus]|uniref:Secreted protein n=1 Tax=Helianthus annuus TaxID=4232 RepID=A0A9K3EJ77_HELAN|nr:hypothetical protein HanXRQr2_Chr13g0600851 [Helianthus annuus]KAJ0850283.1 hypothetical protein HanPSC8_Chr13g0578861 [Helianthus annuus]